jgi:hypothetical protein
MQSSKELETSGKFKEQLRSQIEVLKYKVSQLEINKGPQLQKPRNTYRMKEIMEQANKVLAAEDLNLTELNNLIYATATVATEILDGPRKDKHFSVAFAKKNTDKN